VPRPTPVRLMVCGEPWDCNLRACSLRAGSLGSAVLGRQGRGGLIGAHASTYALVRESVWPLEPR
jgi:hypothetical protein